MSIDESGLPNPNPFASVWRTYKSPLIFGGVSLLFIISSIVLMIKSVQNTTPIKFSRDVSGVATSSASLDESRRAALIVDVAGAVVSPGVYQLNAGSRVADAIKAAGGLSVDADAIWVAKSVNQAQILVDGAKIFIKNKNEALPFNNASVSHNNDKVVTGLVNINLAQASELDSLPGVGPATASKIINNRPYNSLEELVTKKVVGQKLFDNIKNQLTL